MIGKYLLILSQYFTQRLRQRDQFQQIQSSDNPITSISVRYQNYESVLFHNCEEKTILENFANYVADKDPDIIYRRNNSDISISSRVFQHLCARTRKLGPETVQFGRANDNTSNHNKY